MPLLAHALWAQRANVIWEGTNGILKEEQGGSFPSGVGSGATTAELLGAVLCPRFPMEVGKAERVREDDGRIEGVMEFSVWSLARRWVRGDDQCGRTKGPKI